MAFKLDFTKLNHHLKERQMSKTLLDLDSMLEETLDNVEAAPEFIEPPPGKYILSVKSAKIAERTKLNEEGEEETSNVINVVYAVDGTIEIADDETPVPNGSLVSERFQLTNESIPYFKTRVIKILGAETIKGVKLKDMIAALPDAKPFKARITIQVTKGKGSNKGKDFRNPRIAVEGQEEMAA